MGIPWAIPRGLLRTGRSEEGARFPISMVSSGVWAGEIPLERAHNLQEVGGGTKTMKQELRRIGYLGDMDASYRSMPIAVGYVLNPAPHRADHTGAL